MLESAWKFKAILQITAKKKKHYANKNVEK